MEITNSEMEEEIKNFIKVWLKVLISLCYCYAIGKLNIPNKLLIIRLMFIIPIIFLFFYLPLSFTSLNFGATSAFLIAWLANFKLLLFAFGKGPLSPNPPLSLPHFLAVSCLPIKIKSHNKNDQNPSPKSKLYATQNIKIQYLNYPFKALLLGCLIKSYDYSHHMNQKFVLVLYCLNIYLSLDLTLAISRAIKLLGLELEPLFNEPYLSNSLQDFWGRRWNLTVTNVLRPTVYDPTRMFLRRKFKNQEWARFGAVVATFLVSGIMHEVMFYYMGRVIPTGEVTCFFLLHGVCLGLEDWLRKRVGDTWRLPRVVSTVMTVGFVFVTALWLFMPQFSKNSKLDERAFEEYAALGRYVKHLSRRFVGIFLG